MEEQPRRASEIRGNVTKGGRYGTAKEKQRHLEPEAAPLASESAEARPPETFSGALPENKGVKPEDEASH